MTATSTLTPPAQRVDPYVYLGHDVSHLTDVDQILDSVGAGFTAYGALTKAQVLDGPPDPFIDPTDPAYGQPTPGTWVPDGGLAVIRDDTHEVIGKHGDGYVIVQYKNVIEIAQDACGVVGGTLSAVGIRANGGTMYACIDVGDLLIDPTGVKDRYKRYIVLYASHNGKLALGFLPSMVRYACTNQMPAAYGHNGALATKHTKNVADRLALVKSSLGIADAARDAFNERMETLLGMPSSETSFKRHTDRLFGTPKTDREKSIAATRDARLMEIYRSDTCVGSVGPTRLAEYHAIVEYGDHGRGTTADKRADVTITPGSHVEKRKAQALDLLLSAN